MNRASSRVETSGPLAARSAQAAPTRPESAALSGRLSEVSVRELLTHWAAAQSSRDFASYERLYAERFAGTKRVAGYTAHFDRKGWLRDRKPMFKAGVSVKISDVSVSTAQGLARAIFTQDFNSPGFHDVGKKELFIINTAAGIAITREEMLESHVSDERSKGGGVLAFARDGVVIERGVAATVAEGKPHLLSQPNGDPFQVAESPALASLPDATRAWLGREVIVYDGDSPIGCKGRVVRLEIRVSAVPHFGMRQAWAGEDGSPKAAPETIAEAIWSMASDEDRFVVGVLDHSCRGHWASEQALAFSTAVHPSDALAARAIAAFKVLPEYERIARRFREETGDTQRAWESVDGKLVLAQLHPAQQQLIVVSAQAGAGCGGFYGSLSAIWSVAGDPLRPSLTLPTVLDNGALLQVHGSIAADEQGTPALLAGPDGITDEISILHWVGRKYERRALIATSFWDCPC